LSSFAGSSLVVALVTALLLNALFRIGIKQSARLDVPLDRGLLREIVAFCQDNGAAWGARRDVMDRVTGALTEAGELALAGGEHGRPLRLDINYDEFRIAASVAYETADTLALDQE